MTLVSYYCYLVYHLGRGRTVTFTYVANLLSLVATKEPESMGKISEEGWGPPGKAIPPDKKAGPWLPRKSKPIGRGVCN